MSNQHPAALSVSLTAIAAACMLAGCGGGSSTSATSTNTSNPSQSANAQIINGVVTSTLLTAGSSTTPTLSAGYYQGALVCYDPASTGHCAASQNPVTTNAQGQFALPAGGTGPIIADIGTSAINTANGQKVASRLALRIAADQVTEQSANGGSVVISPMSSEVLRAMEANSSQYQTEKANLATRLGVATNAVLADAKSLTGSSQYAVLTEENILQDRYTYATTKLDRGDKFPDALAVAGGNPELTGLANVTAATATTADTRKAITFQQAQQAAMNIEGIPRYDNIFIVMLENKSTSAILGSSAAPNINKLLNAGNMLVNYYSTGNPSEPNYTALGGADDFGITDDAQWNCNATDANAPTDALPVGGNSPFTASCSNASGVSHNIIGKPNLFNALTAKGMQWRTYSESMNPGQDFRTDSITDPAVIAPDNVTATTNLPMPAGLYKTKHHPGMAYQNVRSAPEWNYSNRTLGGGQWDSQLAKASVYQVPANYNVDQFGSDLQSGNVGQINFIMPDQCDDMHGITIKDVNGNTVVSDCASVANNTTTGGAIITRGDTFVQKLVQKIQGSPLWANRQKRVAIVLMFDEGNATSGYNSCCGWNSVGAKASNTPLKQNSDGSWSADPSIAGYSQGTHGHGQSVFGILTNQPNAPTGIKDSDAYSHFSFVRTLQDMFGLADPAKDASYMNRSKYTEKFIAQNLLNLPEFAGSADTHFDAVRPINHAYVIPAGYTQKQSADIATPAQVGPDANQTNVWALK